MSRGSHKHSQKKHAAAELFYSSFTDFILIVRPCAHIVEPPGVWVWSRVEIEYELQLLSAEGALTSTYLLVEVDFPQCEVNASETILYFFIHPYQGVLTSACLFTACFP